MSEVKKEKKETKTNTTKTTKKVAEKEKETKVTKKVTRVKKEEKKEKGLLEEKNQKDYKLLCKIIEIFAKVGRIILMIFVPFIFLAMILIPFIFKNFEIDANIVKFKDVAIIIGEDKATIKIGDAAHVIECNTNELNNLTTFLTENSKNTIVTYIELTLLLFAVIVILDIYLLCYIEKLFRNFVNKNTPFIKENTKYIFKIALFMCALKFISICLGVADISILKVNSISLFGILIIFAIYFIFKYAVKLQEKSTDKICD